MKKDYKKSTMEVIYIKQNTALLVGSYNGDAAYIPGDTTDMNNMA
jgi:hypothetical protein